MSDSPALVETLALVERAASADSTLRLLDETRTGKKLIARALLQLKAIQRVLKRVTMRINTPRILLVGKCLVGSTELLSFLEGLGARLHFSETLAGAAWLFQHCWGTLALRPSEFRAKLRELLGEPHPADSWPWRAPAKNANQNHCNFPPLQLPHVVCQFRGPRKQEE